MSGPGRHRLPLETSQMQWKALGIDLLPLSRFLKRAEKWRLHFHNAAYLKSGMASCCMNVWSEIFICVNTYRGNAQANTCMNAFASIRSRQRTRELMSLPRWQCHCFRCNVVPVVTFTSQAQAFLSRICWCLWQHIVNTQKHKNILLQHHSWRVKCVGQDHEQHPRVKW